MGHLAERLRVYCIVQSHGGLDCVCLPEDAQRGVVPSRAVAISLTMGPLSPSQGP